MINKISTEYAVDLILKKLNIDGTLKLKRAIRGLNGYTTYELVYALITSSSVIEAAKQLGYTDNPIKQSIREVIQPHFADRKSTFGNTSLGKSPWGFTLLNIVDLKYCYYCNSIYNKELFYVDHSKSSGCSSECRSCHITRIKLQKEYYKTCMPKWADIQKIAEIYHNCPKGYHIDHIIPLKGKDVCGLHVEYNLQAIPAKDNLAKSNKYKID